MFCRVIARRQIEAEMWLVEAAAVGFAGCSCDVLRTWSSYMSDYCSITNAKTESGIESAAHLAAIQTAHGDESQDTLTTLCSREGHMTGATGCVRSKREQEERAQQA